MSAEINWVNEFNLPDGYIFKDENGNIINATRIVLEKKKKEYPKTYEECCKVLGVSVLFDFTNLTYKEADLYEAFICLIRCRDAYWKIAGEEMGLGKPWQPDWANSSQTKYCIDNVYGLVDNKEIKYNYSCILAFPTEEIRDAFYENFKVLIEECKELL